MDLVVVRSENLSATEIRTLYSWLSDRQELEGRLKLVVQPIEPGKLGGTDALTVAIGSGGAITALVSGIVSWLRLRYNKKHPDTPVTLRVIHDNGAIIELSAPASCAWSPDEVAAQIEHLALILDGSAIGRIPAAELGPVPEGQG
jgi:hypothetical protein